MAESSLNVLVVEDDEVTRRGIVDKVDLESTDQRTFAVVSAVGSLAAARASMRRDHIDVALIDLELEDGNGLELIRELYEKSPQVLVMVISVFGDERSVIDAIAAGARGYILKDDSAAHVGESLRQLLDGGSPISPGIARHLIDRFQTGQPATTDIVLSQREREVLNYASRGYTYAETASLMQVSVNTVSSYTRRIYSKLAVTSRSQAVFEAQRMGLVDTPSSRS